MKPVSRRTAIKGGLFVTTAAAYQIVPTAFVARDAAAHPTPEGNLYVQGSRDYFGVSVSVYEPNVVQHIPTNANRTIVSSSDWRNLIGGLLTVSLNNGDWNPEQGSNDDIILAKSSIILDQPVIDNMTTRQFLEESSEIYWMRQNPVSLVGVGRAFVVVVSPLAIGFLDEIGRLLAHDVYPRAKAWFLEIFN